MDRPYIYSIIHILLATLTYLIAARYKLIHISSENLIDGICSLLDTYFINCFTELSFIAMTNQAFPNIASMEVNFDIIAWMHYC